MTTRILLLSIFASCLATAARSAVSAPPGFVALYNGRDLSGWRGGESYDHRKWLALPEAERSKLDAEWTADMRKHWRAEGDELVNDGAGKYATTVKDYGNFELLLEYRTVPKADSGIFLRGCPQVQIWDCTNEENFPRGADKGSGGLWNNSSGAPGKDPMVLADRPFGEWNQFRIVMVGELVSVWLNGKHVVDRARLENYYDRGLPVESRRPVPTRGPIQLQTHGGEIRWRNIFLREIGSEEAKRWLAAGEGGIYFDFRGRDFYEIVRLGYPVSVQKNGTTVTRAEYADFVDLFELKLLFDGHNALAIHYPGHFGRPNQRLLRETVNLKCRSSPSGTQARWDDHYLWSRYRNRGCDKKGVAARIARPPPFIIPVEGS